MTDHLEPKLAAALFAERLATQTDVSDVQAALARTEGADFVLVDVRSDAAWIQGHIPGAVHLPRGEGRGADVRTDRPVVVYCWGPGCNGATKAALALSLRGYRVKEMLGGIEYWIREGFAVETAGGVRSVPVDTLTACGC